MSCMPALLQSMTVQALMNAIWSAVLFDLESGALILHSHFQVMFSLLAIAFSARLRVHSDR